MSAFDSAPEDKADVDREIRIERMKRELEELSGGEMISGSVGHVHQNSRKFSWSASARGRRLLMTRISIALSSGESR
jgi:hypothetical protein